MHLVDSSLHSSNINIKDGIMTALYIAMSFGAGLIVGVLAGVARGARSVEQALDALSGESSDAFGKRMRKEYTMYNPKLERVT